MIGKIAIVLVVAIASAIAARAADELFARDAAVKLLGYDPETSPASQCEARANAARIVRVALIKQEPAEGKIVAFLGVAGETGAARAICPQASAPEALAPFVKEGETLTAPICLAAADTARTKLTEHVSALMDTDHPDIVAGYADGVGQALEPIRDACVSHKEAWAKVATQSVLFENRATLLRQGRVCALWRMAVDKELKAATALGQSNGKAAGLAHLQQQAGAALLGSHHYCGEDASAGLVDANFGLTKMLLDSMPEKQ